MTCGAIRQSLIHPSLMTCGLTVKLISSFYPASRLALHLTPQHKLSLSFLSTTDSTTTWAACSFAGEAMGGTFSERGGALAVAAQAGGVWPSMGGLRRPPRAAAPPCVLPQKLELPSAAGGFGSGLVRFGRSSSHRAPIGRRRPAPCSCWPAAARAGTAPCPVLHKILPRILRS